jgi:hypothetical protein
VSSYYYLHLAGLPVIRKPDARTEGVDAGPTPWPKVAAVVFGVGILALPFAAKSLMTQAEHSTDGSWIAPPETTAGPATSREADIVLETGGAPDRS